MTTAVPFPVQQPIGFEWLGDEPPFDADRHLQLEHPVERFVLQDLGYEADEISTKATDFAVSAPFRVLSDEGAAVMLQVGRKLREFHRPAGERIEQVVRGGCYRSRWLRDLCIDPTLTAHLSAIFGVAVAPHPMALHLGHLNYEPSSIDVAVDKWHHDTLPLDFVMMVTDPAQLSGGQFEWFHGSRHEAAELARRGERPPADRTVAPVFPGAGWAIALHGDMVVHRGAGLNEPGERITMVNGYVAADTSSDEQSRTVDLIGVDDPEVLYTEWAKFSAWRGAGRLQSVIDDLGFNADALAVADRLEDAIADVQQAIDQMRAGRSGRQMHYEHDNE